MRETRLFTLAIAFAGALLISCAGAQVPLGAAAEEDAPHTPAALAGGAYAAGLHTSVYLSTDGREAFVTHQSPDTLRLAIYAMRLEDGTWSDPHVAPFSGTYDDNCAAFSADGQRLYFTSNRPRDQRDAPSGASALWFVERAGSGWSEPRYVGAPTEIDRDEGTLYYGIGLEAGLGREDVVRSRWVEGRYTSPEPLGAPVSSHMSDHVVLIAPGERYLILYRYHLAERDARGLYVTFRQPDDTWTEPAYLDDAFGLALGFDASLSPDGQYLFLLDRGVGIYWVDVAVIESFR